MRFFKTDTMLRTTKIPVVLYFNLNHSRKWCI